MPAFRDRPEQLSPLSGKRRQRCPKRTLDRCLRHRHSNRQCHSRRHCSPLAQLLDGLGELGDDTIALGEQLDPASALPAMLFDLGKDPYEKNDLSAERPEILARLRKRHDTLLREASGPSLPGER